MDSYRTENAFSIADYCVFGGMLLISSVIGIYFAYGGKQKSTKEYLMAGRDMPWFPVFVSLLASYLSAITLLGVPSEIYTYGVQYIVLCFSYFILIGAGVIIFLPIFYKLQVVSSNEYLEKRFTPGVRSLGCCLVSLQYILYLAVVLYAPSLALEAVAGVPLTATIISTGLVCTFYTTLGGMKAVIWTDVFQAFVMVTGLIVVIIVGAVELDGFGEVFSRIQAGQRDRVFDFNPDPTTRNTFWTLSIGGAFTAMPVWTVCQPAVQRFQAARSLKESKKALGMNIIGLILIVLLCVMDGCVIYAVYSKCDIGKFGLGYVTSNDQVLPYFIIDKLKEYQGVPGLFTSCLFSGALSTASSGLNSIAAVLLEDVVKKVKPDINDAAATRMSKIIACALGFLVIGLSFLVSKFGTMVLQLAYSIFGIIGGPYLGLFCLGMLVPWSTWKGAYCGVVVGVSTTLWLAVGGIIYPPNKHAQMVDVRECQVYKDYHNPNATMYEQLRNDTKIPSIVQGNGLAYPTLEFNDHDISLASWYSMSYLWYAAIGVSFTFVTGCLVSLFCKYVLKEEEEDVDEDLLFDYYGFFQSLIPKKCRSDSYEMNRSSKGNEMRVMSQQTSMSPLYQGD
ncbi:sodium-coupled monocarboxylate transporter 1-like isoform X2 [Clytia hemisphaerica]